MFKQIIIAMAGAVAAQLTTASLAFAPMDRHDHVEAHTNASSRIVIAPTPDVFVIPSRIATMAPLLGASQIGNRQ